MLSRKMLINCPVVFLFFAALLLVSHFPLTLANDSGSAGGYQEDLKGDGNVSISDFIALILMAREDSAVSQLDYNGDGKYSVADAIALLINIRSGTRAKHTLLIYYQSLMDDSNAYKVKGLNVR